MTQRQKVRFSPIQARRTVTIGTPSAVVQQEAMAVTSPEVLVSDRCRRILHYWQNKLGNRAFPSRADIDPPEILDDLPFVYLVDCLSTDLTDAGDGGTPDFRYRLVGTDIVAHTVADNTGQRLSDLRGQGSQARLTALYRAVFEGRAPFAQRISYATRSGARAWYETMVAPLSSDGDHINMLFGVAEHFREDTTLRPPLQRRP